MKIVFLGTPQIAVPFLEVLVEDKNSEIVAVISSPDAKQGRKMVLQATPVKEFAKSRNLTVFTPKSEEEIYSALSNLDFDCGVVVAYGNLLTDRVLSLCKLGFVNVHFSLLPKYRGASPLQSSLLSGDEKTGITIFKLVKKMDAGPILAQSDLEVSKEDDIESLSKKMTQIGSSFLKDTLKSYENGIITPYEQNESEVSYCHKITKADGKIEPTDSCQQVLNKLRAFKIWPSTFCRIEATTFKIITAEKSAINSDNLSKLFALNNNLYLSLADGCLEIKEIQPEGKQKMSAQAFIQGYGKCLNKQIS